MATNVAVYLLLYLLCVSVSGDQSPSNTYPQRGYGNTFTNLAVYQNTLLIGAKNVVLILNKDNLTKIRQFSTCSISTPNCNNINTVLLVGAEEHLILCGTANGTCQWSKLPAMEFISSTQKLSDNSTSKPIIAFFTQSGLVYFAVTYNGKRDTPFDPLLLYRTSSFSRIKHLSFESTVYSKTSSFEMYFKAGFSHKGFSYFLTNQHYSIYNSTFVSKLVQLCQNDSEPDTKEDQFYSYTDIVISCGTYTFLQDAVVVDLPQNSSVMVATFTKGDNPESLTQSSAVCVFSMAEIEEAVFKERKSALICPNTTTSSPCDTNPLNLATDGYFSNLISRRYNALKIDSQYLRCTTSNVPSWYSIIGVLSPLHKEPVFYKDSKIFTKLVAVTASEDYTAIYVGTQTGNVLKLNLYNMTTADEYQSVTVEPEHPITAILVDQQYEFFLTDTKLYQFPRYRCDMYTTCPQLMAARDPNCGWCVYTGRSTRKSDCPGTLHNHWLSALDQCVSLRSDPGGIPVGTSSTVTIILTPTVGLLLNQTYSCVFSRKVGDAVPLYVEKVKATIDGSKFTCEAPLVSKDSRAKLSLRVNNTILATGDFVFYNCSDYKNCTDCTSVPGDSCVWEFNRTMCTSPPGITQTPDTCPQLKNSAGSLYVHSNSPTEVVLYGNLLEKIKHLPLNCFFPGNRTKTFPATVLNDTITCKITFPLNANEPERKVDIGVMYASTSSRLDDVYHNYVTVYSCATKGRDCSICISLPMSNSYYKCDWCGDSCDYNRACQNICPPPSIIQVTPKSGPKSGGTTITITGSELGPSLDNVSVTIADLPCRTENFIEEFIISKQIVCQTAKSSNSEGNSDVIVTVDNQSSRATFSYLTPSVTDINPKKGPQAGGTMITLTGENLVIGNQRYIVKLTSTNGISIPCVKPNAQGNSSVTCNVPALQNGTTISEIKFCIDELSESGCNLKFAEKGISYTYGSNPSDINITPIKSIQSGGTVLTVRGKGLAIAQDVYVSSSKSTEKVSCTDRSDTKMLCTFPKMSESVRQRSSTDSGVEPITVIIKLDGYSATFDVQYFRDPELAEFADDVLLFRSDQRNLNIQGQYLDLVATTTDFKVTIGVDNCVIVELTNNTLTCAAPKSQPQSEAGVQYPAVNVSIGNINKRIGHLRYEEEIDEIKKIVIIVTIVAAVVIVITAVIIAILVRKRIALKKKAKRVHDYMKALEMEVKNVARDG